MTAIKSSTVACSCSFRLLAAALEAGDATHRALIDPANLQDEYGRFKVWSGNLGAQQKGHSSLDYRLRDSPLLQSNVLKLLRELDTNLNEARAVVSGARLPYEQQANSGDFSDDSASDNSGDDVDSEEERPKFELQQRLFEVIDVLDNLYRLSIRIRSPTIRTRSLKAAAYRQVDPQTGVDVFSQYAAYDKRYTEDALAQLRTGFPRRQDDDVSFLTERLGKAITRRRQQFKYRRKHRDKLASSSVTDDTNIPVVNGHGSQRQPAMNDPEPVKDTPEMVKINLRAPPSEIQPSTLFSGTEATAHHRTLDDAADGQSVTSVATTARDLGGHGIDLPPPPNPADGEKDFECPYCFVICPARYARTRAWKTHLLQDLQSYVCTYRDCNEADQLFRSRREWLEHESSAHRKVWRCPSHPSAVYSSRGAIQHHLEDVHGDDLTEVQVKQLISVSETSTDDLRTFCPICFVDANDPNMSGSFHNHIANHLERFASFALPKFAGPDDDKSGASMDASHGRGSSSDQPQAASTHWSTDTASNDESTRPGSNHAALGFTVTADDMIERLLALLGRIEHSREGFCEEDWLKVRPTLDSFFPQPEASQVFVLLDDLFHNARDGHPDFELLKSHVRGLVPSRAHGMPNPGISRDLLQGNATLQSQYPQIGDVQRLAWSTYLECQDPSAKQPARLKNDLFTIHSTLSTLAPVSNIDASILGDYLIQAIRGATQTLTEIQTAINQSKPYSMDENLARSLCKKLAVWIWRFDALRLSQGASYAERPKLSADAILSVPDASHDKMKRFMESSTPEDARPLSEESEIITGSSSTFEIHAIDMPTEKLKRELASGNTKEPDGPYMLRVSNLPTEAAEKERFAALCFDMDFERFWVDPDDETRGYAKFRTLEDAKRALSTFDVSRLPGIGLEVDNVGERRTEKAAPSQTDHFADFNVEDFLEILSRVLGKPEYGKLIAWAEDGKSFRIVNKEGFSQELLSIFGLEDFPAFRRRLIACGFREAFEWETLGTVEIPELKHNVTWHHKYFERDNRERKSRIRLLTKLKDWFGQTKGFPLAGQTNNRGSAVDMDPFRSRTRFALKSVSDIPSISELYSTGALKPIMGVAGSYLPLPKEDINQKISMLQHDITMLDVDAIVNGTTGGLSAGASDSISYWIDEAAGPELRKECNDLRSCELGQAVMTSAYNLPCRKIIHTVRPHYFQAATFTGHEDLLANCYRNCLRLAVESGLLSIAFPCLSAGGFGFPSREAAEIALNTTRAFLEAGHGDGLQRIIFCVYQDADQSMYRAVIPLVFPPSKTDTGEREVREESPNSVEDYSGDETSGQEQEDVFDIEVDAPGPSKPNRATPSQLSRSVESLSRLTGLPLLWTCCKCRARPIETPNCLVCYHELCDNCEGDSTNGKGPNLSLVCLHPSSNILENSQESGLSSLERRELVNEENQARGSIRSRPNSPTGTYHPTYVNVHRKHLSLDTLFYYDLPFEFDNKNLDHIIIMRELSEEQTRILFEHSRRHRRNLPSIIRTRTHPNPLSPFLTIKIGSNKAFNTEDHHPVDGAPIFLPEPFVTADHCDFYIDTAQRRWMVEVNRASGSTFLNGRRLGRLPVPDDKDDNGDNQEDDEGNHVPLLSPHDTRGYVVRSGDILGLGETDDGKPVYLFRIEVDSVVDDDAGGESALWEEAEARASRYGFPTIGLDEEDAQDDGGVDDDPFGSSHESSTETTTNIDAEDDNDNNSDDDDPEILSGYKIIDAPTTTANQNPQRWTKLDRRLVNPDALKEAGLHYEHRVRYFLVFHELSAGEVAWLAARTRGSREAKTEAELTRKERRRKERRVREQMKKARERKNKMGALVGA